MSKAYAGFETIQLLPEKSIYSIILNRPVKLNALNEQMCSELLKAFQTIKNDPLAKVLVISGKGRAFCAGGDIGGLFLQMIEERHAGKKPFDIPKWLSAACLALRSLPIPTIAAIHGAAIGFGLTICLQCDIRIAAEDATMGVPFVKLGIIPEFGCTYSLPRLVGIARACELIFTGRNVSAQEALQIGLVNSVVPVTELVARAQAMAENIAQGAIIAVKYAKQGLYSGLDASIEKQLKFEEKALAETLKTEDHEEAIRAFLAKRQPEFKGK